MDERAVKIINAIQEGAHTNKEISDEVLISQRQVRSICNKLSDNEVLKDKGSEYQRRWKVKELPDEVKASSDKKETDCVNALEPINYKSLEKFPPQHINTYDSPLCEQVDYDRRLSICCSIVEGSIQSAGKLYETENNEVTLASSRKFWHYRCILSELYKRNGFSIEQIAEFSPVTENTIKSKLLELGIIGKRRVDWTVESSWEIAREKAVERDGECVVCGMSNSEHKSEFGVQLSAHHVVPRRLFDEKRNADSLENLVALCSNCHQSYERTPRELFLDSV